MNESMRKRHGVLQCKIEEVLSENLEKAFNEYKLKHHSDKCPCCGASVRNPYTYAWIAKEIGMSKPSIDNYFSGVAIPSIKTLALIADLLETSIHELLRGVES